VKVNTEQAGTIRFTVAELTGEASPGDCLGSGADLSIREAGDLIAKRLGGWIREAAGRPEVYGSAPPTIEITLEYFGGEA